MTDTAKGLKFAFCAAILSGFSVFINKFAVASLGNPVLLPTTKNSLVSVLLVGLIVSSGKCHQLKSLTKKQIFQLLTIGVVGGFLPFYLFFTGLAQIPAVTANLIHKTLVIWVAILAVPLLKEKVSKLTGLAVLLLFAGNLPIGGFTGFSYSTGELMVFGATLLWALETILVKKTLAGVSPDLVATSRMGVGSLLLIGSVTISNPASVSDIFSMSSTQWLWIVLTAGFLFGYVSLWYHALKFAPAVSVSAVLVSATLITTALSAIFVTHTWNLQTIVQNLSIILGSALIYWSLVRHQKSSGYTSETQIKV